MSNLIATRHATGAHWRRCYGVGVVHMFASYLGTGLHTTFWVRREQPDVDTFPLSTRVNPRKYFAVCCCCCCCLHIKKPSRSRLYPVPPSVSTSISVCLNINLCHPVTQYPGGTTKKIFCGLLDIKKQGMGVYVRTVRSIPNIFSHHGVISQNSCLHRHRHLPVCRRRPRSYYFASGVRAKVYPSVGRGRMDVMGRR